MAAPIPQSLSLTLALLIAGLLFSPSAASTTHTVGGSSAWDVSSNLSAWSSSRNFFVNDSLLFLYGPNHDVIEVVKSDYDLCRMSSPIETYNDGETVVDLPLSGPRFFICGRGRFCKQGLKLAIYVQHLPGHVQAPNPNPSPVSEGRRRRRSTPPPPRFAPSPPHRGTPGGDAVAVAPMPSCGRKLMSWGGKLSGVSQFLGSSVIAGLVNLGLASLLAV